jgi:hypothetical protein
MRPRILLALPLLLIAGCASNPNPAYYNPTIAADYQEFYDKGVTEKVAANAALERARKADPENAYTTFLQASATAAEGDFDKTLSLLETGLKQKKTVIYVATLPPDDPMTTLNRIRQLGFSTERAKDLGDRQPAFFSSVRQAGERVAKAEPTTSLGVMNGIGMIRKSYQTESAYWNLKKDAAKKKAIDAKLAEFTKWSETLSEKLAATLRNLMKDAAKEAGLTEEELASYAKGEPLKDKDKQAKADAAREKMYADEIATLVENLKSMPDVR